MKGTEAGSRKQEAGRPMTDESQLKLFKKLME
jgi:hypothetical protein